MKVQLATINVNGLARSDKVKTIGQWVKKEKIQCVMVQEMTRGDRNIRIFFHSDHSPTKAKPPKTFKAFLLKTMHGSMIQYGVLGGVGIGWTHAGIGWGYWFVNSGGSRERTGCSGECQGTKLVEARRHKRTRQRERRRERDGGRQAVVVHGDAMSEDGSALEAEVALKEDEPSTLSLAAPLGEVPRSSIFADGDSGGGPETPKSGLEMVPVLTEGTHPVRRQMGKRAGLHAIPLEGRQQVDRDVALARERREVERMRKEAELLEWGRRFVEDHQMVGTEKVVPLVEGDQMLIEDAAEDTDLESEPELEVVQEQAAWVDEMVIDSVIVGHAPYGDEERAEMMTFKPSRADRDWVSLLIDRCCDIS